MCFMSAPKVAPPPPAQVAPKPPQAPRLNTEEAPGRLRNRSKVGRNSLKVGLQSPGGNGLKVPM